MNTNTADETAVAVEPTLVLEQLANEYEAIASESPESSHAELIELFGALLAYQLDGHVALIPSIGFGLGRRHGIERRISRAARHLACQAPFAKRVVTLAEQRIADLVGVIDSELAVRANSAA